MKTKWKKVIGSYKFQDQEGSEKIKYLVGFAGHMENGSCKYKHKQATSHNHECYSYSGI